jgi:hypothetical protein
MQKKYTDEEVKYLQLNKFKVEFLSDLSGWWMSRDVETDLFGACTINIDGLDNDEAIILVDKESMDGRVDFIELEYTRENLGKVLMTLLK